jgi:hypothetical protein
MFVGILAFTEKGRETAKKQIQTQKDNLIWNGFIMMSYVNYLNLMKKAKDRIISDDTITIGILTALVLLACPIIIAIFLVKNRE